MGFFDDAGKHLLPLRLAEETFRERQDQTFWHTALLQDFAKFFENGLFGLLFEDGSHLLDGLAVRGFLEKVKIADAHICGSAQVDMLLILKGLISLFGLGEEGFSLSKSRFVQGG